MDALPRHIFRAYDIRGLVGEEIDAAFAKKVGQAFGFLLQQQGLNQLVVGYDGRLSSESLADSLIEGAMACGIHVINVGLVPTPVLYFAAHALDISSAIMITGSHNPSTYNGFKIVLAGRPFAGESLLALREVMACDHVEKGQGSVTKKSILADYISAVGKEIKLKKPLKIVVDAGNGVGGVLLPDLYEKIGAKCVPLFHEVDGHFPNHHPDPSKATNLQALIEAVRTHKADLGIAFDGDADRLGVVTHRGNVVPQDKLLMLFAQSILKVNPNRLVMCDVKCSHLVKQVVEEAGGHALIWKTGHSHIKNKMRETEAILAAEMSGHFFFNDRWYGFDDGPYAGARLLELVSQAEKPLDQLLTALPQTVSTEEILLPVAEKSKFEIIEDLIQYDFGQGERQLIDGVRLDLASSWGLVRASNTSPNLVLRFEAENRIELQNIIELFKSALATLPTATALDLSLLHKPAFY